MNKRKRVGPIIGPCGTPALIANTRDHFTIQNYFKSLTNKKNEEIIWKMSSATL